jgi:CTP synthase
MEAGIQPHIIACRAKNPVTEKVRRRSRCSPTCRCGASSRCTTARASTLIPEAMREAGLDREVLTILDLHDRVNPPTRTGAPRQTWLGSSASSPPAAPRVTIGITGKYAALRDAYASIDKALEHCGRPPGPTSTSSWIDTTESPTTTRRAWRARRVIVPGGFGVARHRGQDRLRPLLPRATACPTWASASASRWR